MQFHMQKPEYPITLNFQKEKASETPAAFVVTKDEAGNETKTIASNYEDVGGGNVRRKPFTFNFVPANPIEIPEPVIEAVIQEIIKADLREFITKGEQYPGVNLPELFAAYIANNRGQRKYTKEWLVQNAADFAIWAKDKISNPGVLGTIQGILEKNFRNEDILLHVGQIDKVLEAYTAFLGTLGEKVETLQTDFITEAVTKVEAIKKPKTIEDFKIEF